MSSNSDDFASAFVGLICWLAAYWFMVQYLRLGVSYCMPNFYERLRDSRKDYAFFSTAMGLLVTALSTPSCAYGAAEEYSKLPRTFPALQGWRPASPEPDGQWDLGTHARVCVAARGVLWAAGLHTLDTHSISVFSYAGSILGLGSWLHLRWPSAVFLTLLASLVSEIPRDLAALVSAYAGAADRPFPALERFRTRLAWVDAVQYTLVRGAGVAAAFWMVRVDGPSTNLQDRPITERLYAYGLLGAYAAYYTFYVLRQRNALRKLPATVAVASPLPLHSPEKDPSGVVDSKV